MLLSGSDMTGLAMVNAIGDNTGGNETIGGGGGIHQPVLDLSANVTAGHLDFTEGVVE